MNLERNKYKTGAEMQDLGSTEIREAEIQGQKVRTGHRSPSGKMLLKVRSNCSLRLMSMGLTLVGTTKRREEAFHLTTGEITPHVQMKQMGEILHKAVAQLQAYSHPEFRLGFLCCY